MRTKKFVDERWVSELYIAEQNLRVAATLFVARKILHSIH